MFKSEKNIVDFKIIMYAIILRIHKKVSWLLIANQEYTWIHRNLKTFGRIISLKNQQSEFYW